MFFLFFFFFRLFLSRFPQAEAADTKWLKNCYHSVVWMRRCGSGRNKLVKKLLLLFWCGKRRIGGGGVDFQRVGFFFFFPLSPPFFVSNPDFHVEQAHSWSISPCTIETEEVKALWTHGTILQVINMSAQWWTSSIHLSAHLLVTGVARGMLQRAPTESTFVH